MTSCPYSCEDCPQTAAVYPQDVTSPYYRSIWCCRSDTIHPHRQSTVAMTFIHTHPNCSLTVHRPNWWSTQQFSYNRWFEERRIVQISNTTYFRNFCSGVRRIITYLKLIPICLAVIGWGQKLRNKNVIFHCDNLGLVEILNSKSSRSPRVMSLVRPLLLRCMHCYIQFKAMHMPGVHNSKAYALSRLQLHRFKSLTQDSSQQACVILQEFWSNFTMNFTD